jgi:2-dehydropantoate 2-reductase
MKILVLGAGALGGYYGAQILEAGAEVTFLVSQKRADQLQESGLVVQSPLGNVARTVHTITRDQVTPDDDLVLLTCNMYNLDQAIAAMAPAVAEHTGILPLLNGMATYDILDQHFGTGRVLGRVAYIAATLAPSGHILHLSPGDTLLIGQRAEATTALAASFYEVVSHTPGKRLLSADITQDLWEKWVMMAAGAAMTCVMRGPIGAILHTQDGRALITQAMDECAAVARLSGPAAIAGYGTGSRLEYLLVPLVFGLGGPLVAMVGTNLGAGQRDRALRAAWIGAAIAAGLTELIGLWAAAVPHAWLSLFDTDPAMLDAGSRYLHVVGPCYGLFGLGMALYFASQGAGRLLWPLLANLMRLAMAAGGGWLALRWSGDLSYVFLALSAALAAFGLINAAAVARGAWFGPIGWPRPRAARV